ncbi:hypothetical protein FAZ69_11240 [Trinickia terrae]|uniref:Uncharacterized protein n=1 Tax=Trinickia terrae TaxID=2571161 RepID=A0A4U1I7T9_9BURK|nr:hypothetical protein [Trinickia terrae]TKC89496.1 hypothetical protein FAZ69_11240 [Trinickia terrae]
MQINNASTAYYPALDHTAGGAKGNAAQPAAADRGTGVRIAQQQPADTPAPTESTRVSLSPKGVAAASADAVAGAAATAQSGGANTGAGSDPGSNANTSTNTSADSNGGDRPDSASGNADASNTGDSASPIKSFVYGTLGLEHPNQQAHDSDGFYSAGKWLGAVLTVGGLISILA